QRGLSFLLGSSDASAIHFWENIKNLGDAMTDHNLENTLVIIKPDSFWRNLAGQVESRVKSLGLTVVAEQTLTNGENHPEEKWQEFYFPAIGDKPAILKGTAKYMAHGPVKG